jgi:hypothetical protein
MYLLQGFSSGYVVKEGEFGEVVKQDLKYSALILVSYMLTLQSIQRCEMSVESGLVYRTA